MSDPVLTEREGPVAIVTLNRPETRNPISDDDMLGAFETVMQEFDADIDVRAVVVTGAQTAFSSGGNLKKMGKAGGLSDPLPAKTRKTYVTGIQRLPLMMEALDVPVIAAVNGPAIGAGLDLACMCDIRIASEDAVFAESFVKVGIVPGDGGAWLLPRIVGFSRATEMALTGDSLSADEALKIGLVSRVVARDDLLPAARSIAARIAANPPHAVRLTKRLLRRASSCDLSQTLEISAAFQALMHATDDHAEAVASILEKRKPVFTGK